MLLHRKPSPPRFPPAELHWHSRHRPLPRRWVLPDGGRSLAVVTPRPGGPAPLDFCGHMRRLCDDVTRRCPALAHVRMEAVLLSFTPSRNRSRYGLQARTTPLRFGGGVLSRRHGSVEYRVQRLFVDGAEMLYVVTFCLPRFLDQTFEEKLVTVFHELYHIGPRFDGDLRRHPGRYAVHSCSKAGYDARMLDLVRPYVRGHPDPTVFDFLRHGYRALWARHGGVTGVVVPRPKLLPVRPAAASAARIGGGSWYHDGSPTGDER